MKVSGPIGWLARQAGQGVIELPENVGWLLDKAVARPVQDGTQRAAAAGQGARALVAE